MAVSPISLTVFSESGSVFNVCSGVGSSALLMNQIIEYSILLCKYERYNDILSQGLALLRRLAKMFVVSDVVEFLMKLFECAIVDDKVVSDGNWSAFFQIFNF